MIQLVFCAKLCQSPETCQIEVIDHEQNLAQNPEYVEHQMKAFIERVKQSTYLQQLLLEEGTHLYEGYLKNPCIGYEVSSWRLLV